MAITRVTHTTEGFDAINYALKGKPHVDDKFVSGRVMASSGVNCTVHGCRTQMNAVWKHYGINRPTRRHRRQVQRLIQSFDPHQLSYKNPVDVAKANAIGRKLASKLYPNRQSIVVTQADNKRHILHNHIITNMLDFRTGKSMTGKETSWQHVQEISDDVIKDYGLNPVANKRMGYTLDGKPIPRSTFHQTDAEYHIKKRGKYSWVDDISSRVSRAVLHSASMSEFIKRCRDNHVICDPYRKHKGGIRHDDNGRPILKKHMSFKFKGADGKEHHIRDRKIGSAFNHDGLKSIFSKVAIKRQHQRVRAIQRQQAHQKHMKVIKIDQERKNAERQRKEKTEHERIFVKQFKAMAEINKRQHQLIIEQSEDTEPTLESVPARNTKSKDNDGGTKGESIPPTHQKRIYASQPKHNSIFANFISHTRRQSKRLKRLYFWAGINYIKHRIAKAIDKKITQIRERIQQRINHLRYLISKRDRQREIKHKHKQWLRNYKRRQREQGGPDWS